MANPFNDYLERSIADRPTPAQRAPSPFVSFMPNMKYVDKNWAPEQYPLEAIEAIARAQALGEKSGAFSSAHGAYFFPTQLIEKRPIDFGTAGPDRFWSSDKNPFQVLGNKFGLLAEENPKVPGRSGYSTQKFNEEENFEQNRLVRERNAKVAAMMFAIKSQNRTPVETAERWNGSGRVVDGNKVFADSKNHLAKVEEMMRMMDHPSNAEIKKVWQYYYGQALKEK